MWNWSVPVFRLAGVPVKLHWTILLWWALELAQGAKIGGMALHLAIAGIGILFVHVLLHEFGHVWGARGCRLHVDEVVLWFLGGWTRVAPSEDPAEEIRVTLPGPLVNLGLAGLTAGAILALGVPWSWTYLNPLWGAYPSPLWAAILVSALKTGILLTAFNLLVPAHPLDGGRILLALLTLRRGRWPAMRLAGSIGMLSGLGLLLLALYWGSFLLGMLAVSAMFEGWQMKMIAENTIGEEGATYSGRGYRIAPTRREGFFERRRREKAEREAAARAGEDAALREKVDAVLDKVSREGISSLSPDERRLLEKASERYRGN